MIVGYGGLAREIKWLIDRINEAKAEWNFCGYIDNMTNSEVIGDDDFLTNYKHNISVVIGIGDVYKRNNIFNLYQTNNRLQFPNLIDPSVIYSQDMQMGIGNIICAGSILTVNIKMSNFNIINLDCTIGHDSIIESYITLNPSVNISGNVKIESFVNIGTGAHIIQGKNIMSKTVIGAGAVVINHLPIGCTAVGVPAKIIKSI